MTDPFTPRTLRYDARDLGVSLFIEMPEGLHVLLAQLLAGWTTSEPSGDHQPDLAVKQDGSFFLASRFFQSGKTYADIVSMLNELLVGLAYAVRAKVPDSALIHAAGLEENGEARVVFGARKAGKSVMTARYAARGARIWADDLLLWFPRQRLFKGLGIAPRLRRPVLDDILSALPDDALIAGEYTCYVRASKIDLAPAGSVLKPDILVELQPDQSQRRIGWLKVGAEIERHRIP